jgi:hypothetical protein
MFSKETVDRGWESNHQRLKKGQLDDDDRWRLRDWDAHPNDPGWEDGTYSSCHADFRSKVRAGEIVFDTVYSRCAVGETPIIRSAFVVNDVSDGELSFDEFVFLDGDPSDGVRSRIPRGHRSLDRAQVESYLQQIKAREAYTRYSIGSRPKSIPGELWEKMLEKAGTVSTCSSCTSRRSRGNRGSDSGCD